MAFFEDYRKERAEQRENHRKLTDENFELI